MYLLGDVAFDKYWLERVGTIKCRHLKLICGNHDLDFHHMKDLVDVFDSVETLFTKRNFWLTHCPIHPQEMRTRKANIHGHLHGNIVLDSNGNPDPLYINVCVEHTNWKPVSFQDATKGI